MVKRMLLLIGVAVFGGTSLAVLASASQSGAKAEKGTGIVVCHLVGTADLLTAVAGQQDREGKCHRRPLRSDDGEFLWQLRWKPDTDRGAPHRNPQLQQRKL